MGIAEVAAALQQRKPAQPFMWGSNGEALTPEQVATRRKMADSLRQREGYTPIGIGTLIGSLAGEAVANAKDNDADAAAKTGHDKVAKALEAARASGDYTGVMSDEWATPGQRDVAGALQSRGWQQADRAENWAHDDQVRAAGWAREDARASAEASRPKWETFDDGSGNLMRYNAADPNSRPEMFFDGPDKPGYRALSADEKAAYGLPPDSAAQVGPDGKVDMLGGSGQTINVNNGGADSDFYSAAAKARGQQFVDTETAGMTAQSKIGQINRLEGLLKSTPQGMEGAAKQFAGELGIPTEGLGSIQAVQGIINKMVPDQRQPGSGTMSDGDVALFKASLPRIVNQPGGNDLIIQTLKGIAVYEQQQGEIASKVLNRELTPAEGREAMRAVKNPLELFRGDGGSASDAGNSPEGVDPADWAAMTPEQRALWD